MLQRSSESLLKRYTRVEDHIHSVKTWYSGQKSKPLVVVFVQAIFSEFYTGTCDPEYMV